MNLPEEYRDLVEGYLASLEPTCAQIDALALALVQDQVERLAELRAIAHKLAGNGASFGFPEITDAAKAVTLSARAYAAQPAGNLGPVAERARALAAVCRRACARADAGARSEFTDPR